MFFSLFRNLILKIFDQNVPRKSTDMDATNQFQTSIDYHGGSKWDENMAPQLIQFFFLVTFPAICKINEYSEEIG